MKKTIFISSTYQDLATFREEIWNVLIKKNVRILGMEKFGARKSKPLKTCLDEVSKSDIYIGIIGTRYGSIEKESGKSFTQLEYEHAISLNLDILIYIIDEDCRVQIKYVDRGENAEKLENFKNYLKSNHTIDTFNDESKLAKKINDRLKELIPNFSTSIIRPKVIDCNIYRFNIGKEPWIAFLGIYAGQILEIYTGLGDEEIFPIPQTINRGKIIKNRDDEGNVRFDFQYTDKYGYKNTMGGISHIFNKEIHNFLKIINGLLQDGLPKSKLIEYIDHMDTSTLKPTSDWKNGLIIAIKKCYG